MVFVYTLNTRGSFCAAGIGIILIMVACQQRSPGGEQDNLPGIRGNKALSRATAIHYTMQDIAGLPRYTIGTPSAELFNEDSVRIVDVATGKDAVVGVFSDYTVTAVPVSDTLLTSRAIDIPFPDSARPSGDPAVGLHDRTLYLLASGLSHTRGRGLWTVDIGLGSVKVRSAPDQWGRLVGASGDGAIVLATPPTGEHLRSGQQIYRSGLVQRVSRSTLSSVNEIKVDTIVGFSVQWDSISDREVLFAHQPAETLAVTDNMVWFAPGAGPEIVSVSLQSELAMRITWEAELRPVTTEDVVRWRERLETSLASLPEHQVRITLALAHNREIARTFPVVRRMLASPDHRIFVEESGSRDAVVQRWLIFSERGTLEGTFTVSAGVDITGFLNDAVLVRRASTQLVMYPIVALD